MEFLSLDEFTVQYANWIHKEKTTSNMLETISNIFVSCAFFLEGFFILVAFRVTSGGFLGQEIFF